MVNKQSHYAKKQPLGSFATQLVSYTNPYDQLSNVEVFSYPPLAQLKQDFINTDLYSIAEISQLEKIRSYAETQAAKGFVWVYRAEGKHDAQFPKKEQAPPSLIKSTSFKHNTCDLCSQPSLFNILISHVAL